MAAIRANWKQYHKATVALHEAEKLHEQTKSQRAMKRIKSEKGKQSNLFWKLCSPAKNFPHQQVVLKSISGGLLYYPVSIASKMSEFWNTNAVSFASTNSATKELKCSLALQRNFHDSLLSEFQKLLLQPFCATEVKKIVNRFDNKTSVSDDQIPKSFVKSGSPLLQTALAKLFTQLLEGHTKVSEKWLTSKGIFPHKSGDTAILDNYGPIIMTCTLRMLYSALLQNRLSAFVETANILSDNQQGARPTRSTSDIIFIVQQLREECHRKRQQCISVFLDLSRAFDRVNRAKLYEVLKLFHVPFQFIQAIKNFYRTGQSNYPWVLRPQKNYNTNMVSFKVIHYQRFRTSFS